MLKLLRLVALFCLIVTSSWISFGIAVAQDGNTGQLVLLIQAKDRVTQAEWNFDESRILTVEADNVIRVWDAADGTLLKSIPIDYILWTATWSPDGTRIMSRGGEDTDAQVWDVETGKELVTLHGEEGLWNADWNQDGTRIMGWTGNGKVRVWDANTGEELLGLEIKGGLAAPSWSPDETRILAPSGKDVVVWDANTGEELLVLQGHQDQVWGGRWSSDGSRILSVGEDNTLGVWDASTGEQLMSASAPGVTRPEWNPAGTQILTAYEDTVQVWDVSSGEAVLSLQHDGSSVQSAHWNQAGSQILTSAGARVYLWDASTGAEILSLQHEGEMRGAVWNQDETRILSWALDETAKVWDITSPMSAEEAARCRGSVPVRAGHWEGPNAFSFTVTDAQEITNFEAHVPFAGGTCSISIEAPGGLIGEDGSFSFLLELPDPPFIGYFEGCFSGETMLTGQYSISLCGDTMAFSAPESSWNAQWVSGE